MMTRIAPGVGANLLGQHSAGRNQDAAAYVGNLDSQVTEELLWELFVQAGPVVNVYVTKDRVTNQHQGYGFVQFWSEEDADYAMKVLNMIKLYGKPIWVNKDVDEKLLYDTFSAFGVIVTNPKIMRDPDTGNSCGFGFMSYGSSKASDSTIEAMNGQYLYNRQITVSYAYKKDTKGERHGTSAERVLAASNPSSQRSRPHTLLASGPPTLPNVPQANGSIAAPAPPHPVANGVAPPAASPALRPPPPPQAVAFPPIPVAGQPEHGTNQQRPGQRMPPPPPVWQFRPSHSSVPPPPPPQAVAAPPRPFHGQVEW